jgi:hypothetical protein
MYNDGDNEKKSKEENKTFFVLFFFFLFFLLSQTSTNFYLYPALPGRVEVCGGPVEVCR